jgi:hypothetical protein
MINRVVITALISTLAWVGAASAATVNVTSGSVSINGGKPVTRSVQVKVGDTVTAGPKGNANIVYANNCSTPVAPGSTVSVTYDDHCALGLAGVGAGGVGVGGALVGAAVIAGAVGIAVAVSSDGRKKKPSSP